MTYRFWSLWFSMWFDWTGYKREEPPEKEEPAVEDKALKLATATSASYADACKCLEMYRDSYALAYHHIVHRRT